MRGIVARGLGRGGWLHELPVTPSRQKQTATDKSGTEGQFADALERMMDEGRPRLERTWPSMLATGAVAGAEVSIGVLALLTVEAATHGNPLLGGLAFSFGFVALLLGHSELFTEGFLVPIAVVVVKQAKWRQLVRFWLGILVANLAGGWVLTWFAMRAYPELHAQAVSSASFFIDTGIGLRSFSMAVLGGSAITLMTRMHNGTDSVPARLVASIMAAFVLAGLRLGHSVLDSLLIFSALHNGSAPFGYLDWLGWFGWAVLGNAVGGIGLVTLLRLVRSKDVILERRAKA
jgi:formate/nitrite transporter FocA (FNT family)